MTALETARSRRTATPLLAIGEWVMILPASIFLAAAALRQMQPAQFEPTHTSWVIFNWAVSHVTHTGAAVIFLALPAAALLVGSVALLRAWSHNQIFRRDAAETFAILRRNFSFCLIIVATVLGGTILAAVIAHLIIG
ncbi:MAG TPA: hypothetical protein VJS43_09645 [Candidatus Acidoferrales bacterium]|nr:hypothetical protein [Candidatus Acidoferrales bacterium]